MMSSYRMQYSTLHGYNDTINFIRAEFEKLVDRASIVLDAGCGRGNPIVRRDSVGRLIGVDIDVDSLAANPDIHRGIVADLQTETFTEDYFDVVFSFDVIEHLVRPDKFLQHAIFALKPGGHLFLVTPNICSLFGIVAKITSSNLKRQLKRASGHYSETENHVHYYRANSARALCFIFDFCSVVMDVSLLVLNRLPSNSIMKYLFWPSFQICRFPLMRRYGSGLLVIARKTA